jgi:hypothetical protein
MQSASGTWKVADVGIPGTERDATPRFSRETTGSKKTRADGLEVREERMTCPIRM